MCYTFATMDEDTITDLKQFITATVSQQTIELERSLDKKLDEKLDQKLDEKLDEKLGAVERRITKKIDDLSAAVAEAMEANTTATDERLDNHEKRLVRLEHKTA